ncbi:MAG: glutamate racemase [Candidatus Eisenbacteria bacterium]|nr:glutamate racemase [Candidatus Eisenbacteria bacterium]
MHDQKADRPIGVFDSGIGGLTVVRQLLSFLPDEDIVYFGDTARVPYGTKSPETVTRFTREAARFLAHRGVKCLVLACNTASALALPALREDFELPMAGVILPGARAAGRATRNRRIGVIGTVATVRSGAYEAAIRELDPAIEVRAAACPLFVPLAEEGWIEGEVVEQAARIYLAPLLASGVDTLILGCTHYPLLKTAIARIAGPEVTLIDTAEETVREVEAMLRSEGLRRDARAEGHHRFFVSDVPAQFSEVGARFLGRPLSSVEWVRQEDLPWYER